MLQSWKKEVKCISVDETSILDELLSPVNVHKDMSANYNKDYMEYGKAYSKT